MSSSSRSTLDDQDIESVRQIANQIDAALGLDQQPTHAFAPEHQLISRLLHDRLTRLPPSQWPLHRLHGYLDTLFHPGAALDQYPLARPLPTVAAAAAPPAANADPRTPPPPADAMLAPLEESPRAQRANRCADVLASKIDIWSKMLQTHTRIVHSREHDDDDDDDDLDLLISSLIKRILKKRKELVTYIPEFSFLEETDKEGLVALLTTVYAQLESRISVYHEQKQFNNALALVLVHLAVSWASTAATSFSTMSAEILSFNRHFASQFDRQYRGRAPARFIELISKLDRELDSLGADVVKPYFRGTPIVQSSGTGKTRMVLECRHLTPLLYVCFRSADHADGNAKAGFPFPDKNVVPFFRKAQSTRPLLCDLHVACFLGAWFLELALKLELLPTDAQKHQALLHLHHFDPSTGRNDERDKLFKDVTERAEVMLGLTDPVRTAAVSDAQIFERHLLGPLLRLNQQVKGVSDHIRSLLHHGGDGSTAAHASPVIIAFDECVEMNVGGENNGINPLNSLRRAWHWISDMTATHRVLSFWLVLMSTSSSAAQLVEHIDAKTSIRAKGSASLPTFVGVGFDMLLLEQQSLTRAEQAFSFEHMIAYGRPLWSSLEPGSFWPTAILKLLCSNHFDVNNAMHCYSVMASRLALSLVPTHSSRSAMFAKQKLFMAQQVDRHMRIVTHVSADASMYVRSPSEPVLAVAASLLMLPSAEQERHFVKLPDRLASNTYGAILESFCQRCLHGADVPLHKGVNGELASRIALMAACDAIKRRRLDTLAQARVDSLVEIISEAVPVDDMLAGLADLDGRNRDQLRQRISDVHAAALRISQRALLRGAYSPETSRDVPQAWTHFTHFDVLAEPISQITPEYLWYCWKRGVALQMHHDQHGIDGIIPVFMGRLDQAFTQSAAADANDVDEMHAARYMTYVAWESKNQATAQGQPSDQQKAAKLAGPRITRASVAAQEEPLTERALISLLFDMGTTSAFQEAPRSMRPRLLPIAGQSCLRLVIRGMSDEHAYPCLDELKLRDIFGSIVAITTGAGSHEQLNVMPDAMWNAHVQPGLASISGAQGQQQQQQQQHAQAQARRHGTSMDLD